MGAITRAAANNFTTSGVILPAAINDASVASITELENVSAGGENFVLLTSQTASASSSIDFTSSIDSTYKVYLFKYINCHPSIDSNDFQVNFSTDGGSNYNVVKTTTFFQAYHSEADDSGLGINTGGDLSQSSSAQFLTEDTGSDNDQGVSGNLYLYNPSGTSYVKPFNAVTQNAQQTDYSQNVYVAGYGNTTSAINAVRFSFSSGNIDDGKILMYGIG